MTIPWTEITACAAVVAIIISIFSVFKSHEAVKAAIEGNKIEKQSLNKTNESEIEGQAPNLLIEKDLLIVDAVLEDDNNHLKWQYKFFDLTSENQPINIPAESVTLGKRLIKRNGIVETSYNQFFLLFNSSEKDTGKGQKADNYTELFGKVLIRNYGYPLKKLTVKEATFILPNSQSIYIKANPNENTIDFTENPHSSENYIYISYLFDNGKNALCNMEKVNPENIALKSRYGGERNQLGCDLKVILDLYERLDVKFLLVNSNNRAYEQTISVTIKNNQYSTDSSTPEYIGPINTSYQYEVK
ncbi:MAG: hypothetical protein RR413_12560 [Christensenellaceae bacterium]